MQVLQIVVLVLAVSVAVESAAVSKLPKWVTNACYRDDPKFDECAIKSGQTTIAGLVRGDKQLHLPVLDPLHIAQLKVDKAATSLGMDVSLKDATLAGLTDTVLKDLHIDFDKHHMMFNVLLPRLEIVGTYNISGKILVLPIAGSGPGNLTLFDTTIIYDADYDKKPLKNDQEYIVIKDFKVKFVTTKAVVKLENLFNGDKLLGDNVNQFMNENWRELIKEVGPLITDTIADLVTRILKHLTDNVPFDDIAPLAPK